MSGIDEMIQRINELYHKSQAEGLTAEEKEEQARLRSAYVANVRNPLKGQVSTLSIGVKVGTISHLGDSHGKSDG